MSKDNDALITALLFVNEDSGSLVIHFNGFQDSDHMDKFANKVLKKIGIDYHKIDDIDSAALLQKYPGLKERRAKEKERFGRNLSINTKSKEINNLSQ